MFNKVILIGRLGQNAEAKTAQNNKEYVTLNIATQESWKNDKGEYETRTEWHRVFAWRNLSKFAKTLQKGQLITLEGTLRYRDYQEEVHGLTVKHWVAEIHAVSMKRLSKVEATDDASDGADDEGSSPARVDETGTVSSTRAFRKVMWNCVCLDKGGHLITAGDKPQQQTRQYFATIAILYFCFIIAPRRLNMAQTEHFDLKPDGGIPRGYTSSEEYQAGYEARLRDEAEYPTATLWWRTGWADADRELRSGAAKPHIEQGEAPGMRWSNFGTGQQARICQLPFDENQAEAWKRNWVQTDIAISLAHRAKPSLDSVRR